MFFCGHYGHAHVQTNKKLELLLAEVKATFLLISALIL